MTDSPSEPSTETETSEGAPQTDNPASAEEQTAPSGGSEDTNASGEGSEQAEPQKPLEPLPPPSHQILIFGNALAVAAIIFDLIDRLMDGLHQNDSAFRGFSGQIPTLFYGISLGLGALVGLYVLYRLLRFGRNREDKAFRLLPIAAVLILSADWFFIRAFEEPAMPPESAAKLALRYLAARPMASEDGLFPLEPKFYADAAGQIPPPFWKGTEKLTRWNIRVLEGCTTSVSQISMDEPGTLIVCLSEDRKKAWISAVVLSRGKVGLPALAQENGTVLAAEPRIIQKKNGADEAMNPAAFF